MEYKIVPNCIGCGNIKKQRRGDHFKKENKQDLCDPEEENRIYILQPMFKPPKSTRDVVNTTTDDLGLAVMAISDINKDINRNGQFNHFTMSRKGVVKYNDMSRVEDTCNPLSPKSTGDDEHKLNKNSQPDSKHNNMYAPSRQTSGMGPSGRMSKERTRRASAGDALVKYRMGQTESNSNDIPDSPHMISIGPDEVVLIPSQKRQQQTSGQTTKRRDSAGKVTPQEYRLQVPEDSIPRRKSFHDWYSIQEWYSTEPRPVSTEVNSRRNVISPNTLSRIMPPNQNREDGLRVGSARRISVCTEGDRLRYNFNLPSRRLVSHKDLKDCSLPYSDNIGLEETVSSDQARKAAKTKKSVVLAKKKFETSKQTPKQVWYRTIRSILAANHLYHSVKRKKSL